MRAQWLHGCWLSDRRGVVVRAQWLRGCRSSDRRGRGRACAAVARVLAVGVDDLFGRVVAEGPHRHGQGGEVSVGGGAQDHRLIGGDDVEHEIGTERGVDGG